MSASPQAIHLIPLGEIDAQALVRDRTAIDPEAQRELCDSIAKSGLRMPVEVYAFPEPRGAHRYGLVSGFRRLAAFRALHGERGLEAHAAIPAFVRTPADRAEAMAAMVEENAVRAGISPWESARVAAEATNHGLYGTLEEAVDHLFPTANAMKRSRIRAVARVVEALDGLLSEPEHLSLRQLLRLAGAIREGFAEPLEVALRQTRLRDPASQWAAMLPYLVEAERFASSSGEPTPETREPATRGRPRRILAPRPHLVVRREITRDGYILRFTGREATSGLLDEVLDQIDRWLSPG
jgi:ParB family chromosome partitioning protein